MINVGIIGLGCMGKVHFGVYGANRKSKVAAISDVNEKKLKGDWSEIAGNIDEPGAKNVNLKGITAYKKAEDLICDSMVHVVDITLPTFLHAKYVIKALEAGKDVICEKPMCMNLREADKIIEAVRKTGKKLMIAHCIRFWPEYEMLRKIIKTRRFGKLYSASFSRLGAAPIWGWHNWLQVGKLSGGAALDLHIHDTDFINWCLGMPREVFSTGTSKAGGAVDYILTNYNYRKGLAVRAEGGWVYHPTFGFEMSYRAIFEKATVVYSFLNKPPLVIHTSNGKKIEPKIMPGNGHQREINYFLTCIGKNKKIETVTPEDARNSIKVVLAEIESAKKGKPVLI